jgi:hypothetical protein
MALAGLALFLLVACGGGSGTLKPIAATAIPNTGNWSFGPVATPGTISLPPFFGGSLTVAGNNVTADVLPNLVTLIPSGCSLPGDLGMTLAGTLNQSQITLTSASWNGEVIGVSGTVSADGNSISGTWSVKGGCTDGLSGHLLGSYVPPVTGTWSGTAGVLPGQTNTQLAGATLTLQLQQSATPDQFSFPLTGTVKVAGSPCGFTSGTLLQPGGDPLVSSSITGNLLSVEAQMDDGKTLLIATGAPSPPASGQQWTTVFEVLGGGCDGAMAIAPMSRQ